MPPDDILSAAPQILDGVLRFPFWWPVRARQIRYRGGSRSRDRTAGPSGRRPAAGILVPELCRRHDTEKRRAIGLRPPMEVKERVLVGDVVNQKRFLLALAYDLKLPVIAPFPVGRRPTASPAA